MTKGETAPETLAVETPAKQIHLDSLRIENFRA